MAIEVKLKELRESRGLSMAKVAEALEIPKSTYVSYEYGAREPNIEMINHIADFYGVSTDYLLGRENAPETAASILQMTEDEMEEHLLEAYYSLPQHLRDVFIEDMKKLLEKRKGGITKAPSDNPEE